jgi:YidC/Oxa1 family membrane protein insertase
MEKRSIIAIALSMLVLLVWSSLMPKPQPVAVKGVTASAPTVTSPALPAAVPMPDKKIGSLLFNYSSPMMDVVFDEAQACISEVIFKEYKSHKFVMGNGLAILDQKQDFIKQPGSPNPKFNLQSGGDKSITKEFILSNSNYGSELRISVQSKSAQPIKMRLVLALAKLDIASRNAQAMFKSVFAVTDAKTVTLNGRKDVTLDRLKFVALRDKYFAAIVEPEQGDWQVFVQKIDGMQAQAGIMSQEFDLLPGQNIEQKFRMYLGPQDLGMLNQIDPHWSAIINFGTFDFIGQVLLYLLKFFYAIVHNWGWAIVVLSVAVFLLLYPLTLKQMRSMKAMQALQPRIEDLRQTYKDNPQKLNKEIMELYKEHKVNPFSGCLPLLLQMPIFFALYQVLMRSVALKGAQFLWIKDLSEPDRLFTLPSSLPVLGNEFNILPILMAIGMFFQQKMSMASQQGASGAVSAQQQKMMLIIFPLMFGVIFYHMPSGLVLYWFINSGLMLVNQIKLARAK